MAVEHLESARIHWHYHRWPGSGSHGEVAAWWPAWQNQLQLPILSDQQQPPGFLLRYRFIRDCSSLLPSPKLSRLQPAETAGLLIWKHKNTKKEVERTPPFTFQATQEPSWCPITLALYQVENNLQATSKKRRGWGGVGRWVMSTKVYCHSLINVQCLSLTCPHFLCLSHCFFFF